MFRKEPVTNLQADDFIKRLEINAEANKHEITLLKSALNYFYFVKNCQHPANADVISKKLDTILQALKDYAANCPQDNAGAYAFSMSLIKMEMESLHPQHPFHDFYHQHHTDLKKYLEGHGLANRQGSGHTPNGSPTKSKG